MDLLDHLPASSGQTPFCGGNRRNRLLFDKKYPPTGRSAVSLTTGDGDIPPGKTWRVSMGVPAGVVPGTEFSVLDQATHLIKQSFSLVKWEVKRCANHTVCTLVAQTVKIQETILVIKESTSLDVVIPENARAVVSDWKNNEMIMRVYIPEGFPHIAALFPTKHLHLQQGFVQATSRQDAQLALRIPEDDHDSVVVERFTSTIFECEPEARFPLKDALQLSAAVSSIAHFNYFLERRHGSAPLKGVSLEVYRLMGNFPARQPDRRVGQNGNQVIDNHALFKSENGAKYGIIIRNASSYDLFPYLFAFDPTDYTIGCLYSPHSAIDPPLQSFTGEVTIGMGGQRALDFTLPRGVKKSSAFLKLFVATKAIDIDWIQQETSPFDTSFQGRPRLSMCRGVFQDTWDAFTVTLTMTA
ncbi:hypothetical protein DFH07DRAFT_960681 [Mycena maculata]|uniref:Uncharacterized protein n=1 Tax=Mycena maculata TaxID=230809 RepID=A0AAD7J051_9AGAR|nr:hypothetical protein DFH07DRAFT_960681 [Mycena maculata]